ncbi:hypothetical protein [Amycolatopsis sp. FDAARGOS 1241]|uniref:hypothetical protein n=1 Tax=Amycolatopsis sp. FDAARGOS 1241 TaxID=2778070 RepID=UPI001951EEE2|nr:hypothetical protein [Amycolatopsis sp. FDAARGOS 1241]QRP50358.1 hypothetical protein I6J71_23315 [Amycolatopsis sp. FDAARGOS 1241]
MTQQQARAQDLLGDRFAPHPHFSLVRHTIVDAPVKDTYAAARDLDLTDIHSGLLTAAERLRELPQRWRGTRHGPPRQPTRLTVDDLDSGSDWTLLGEHPGTEFAVGVAGKFWRPVITLRRVEPEDFEKFSEPGYGKLVITFGVRPYGVHRSLLTIDSRVQLTDPQSWLKFRRYWRVAYPFARMAQTTLVRTIDREARERSLATYSRDD